MPIAEAVRRCPKATFVQGPFGRYREASQQVREVLEKHAPLVVMTGLDEGYLDFSGTDLIHPTSLLNPATDIRNEVHTQTGLDCSIGIGPNRMIAKIASDYAKPRGICEVREGWERGFMAGLPLRALPGIGPKTAERLAAQGLEDVAQVQAMSPEALTALVGRDEAMSLIRRADGRGGSSVRARERAKSVSRETTFFQDISDLARLDRVLLLLIARVAGQLRDEELEAGALVLKLRHGDFVTVTRRITLKPRTALDGPLRDAARKLLAPAFAAARQRGQAIRLLGVAATSLEPTALAGLFTPAAQIDQENVARAVDKVRERYGFDAMRPGRLVDKKRQP
jgi:DNA polymerase-4